MRYNVEIFHNGKFWKWYPAATMKGVLDGIAHIEGAEKLCDLRLSYLVFQRSANGSYTYAMDGENYHKACAVNATGAEVPYFITVEGGIIKDATLHEDR